MNKQLDKFVTALTAVLNKVASAPATSAPPAVSTAPPSTASAVPTTVPAAYTPASYHAQVRAGIMDFLRPAKG